MTALTRLQTDKSALERTRLVSTTLPSLAPGEALLKLGRFALTTNNITYAAFGDAMQYWNFFPSGDEGWGQMPVWGFADVVASEVPNVEVGERFYGYWPIASHLVMQPVRVTPRGFYDGSEHRQSLTSAYNQYTRVSTDTAYRVDDENYQMLLRPLFITSFMLADFLEDNAFFGAKQLVISSASSKTAYGTTFCLQNTSDVKLIGITSASNKAFVDSLGCYHDSVNYDALETLDQNVPTLYVDFSGDDKLRGRVHRHFGAALKYDCYAGSSQSHDYLRGSDLPGPTPQPYFAPIQIKKRNTDWGPAVVNEKFNAAQLAFIRRVSDAQDPWLKVEEHEGFQPAQGLIEKLCAGRIDPRQGYVVTL